MKYYIYWVERNTGDEHCDTNNHSGFNREDALSLCKIYKQTKDCTEIWAEPAIREETLKFYFRAFERIEAREYTGMQAVYETLRKLDMEDEYELFQTDKLDYNEFIK